MKRLVHYVKSKLSIKVSLWVVMFAAVIFMAALGFFFVEVSKTVHIEAVTRASKVLDNTCLRVEGILNRVEVANNMTCLLAQRHINDPDSMMVYCQGMLKSNPDFYNCSIAFEPYYFEDKGKYFSAYSRRAGDSIKTMQGGSDRYQYFYMDWYLSPKLLDRPCWTDPYIEVDVSTNTGYMVTSYCQPIKDNNGEFVGVVNTSLSLNWLSHTVSHTKPYPNSYSFMIGRGGTFLVHPDSTKITRYTIFTETLENPNEEVTELGYAMLRGEEGMKQMMVRGEDCYVFYKPLGNTGCSMGIVCPVSDIFGAFNNLRQIVILIVLGGLFLMLFFFIRIITKELRPLRRLAVEAETIASGQFDTKLPNLNRIDEIGQLSHSFSDMQESLIEHILELKETTAQKASIESELSIARRIQMSMLPKEFPPFNDCQEIDVYGQLTPAKAVGGDLYDFYVRDRKLFFCIGDVSGKGVPASLVMAVTRTLFRNVSAHESKPESIVSQINNGIANDNEVNMFVTLFVGVLDLNNGQLDYCNAGHDAPLIINGYGEKVEFMTVKSNMPAGAFLNRKFVAQNMKINNGALIFLYTDGLTEANNIKGELYGVERVVDTAQHAVDSALTQPRTFLETINTAVRLYVGEAEQSDDLTMLAIRYEIPHDDCENAFSISLPNDVKTVPTLSKCIDKLAEKNNIDKEVAGDMKLAMEEAVVNVMSYAYPKEIQGMVYIEAKVEGQWVTFVISDSGKPFNPLERKDPDITLPVKKRPIGGLGIFLVTHIMDDASYQWKDNRNILTLKKKIS